MKKIRHHVFETNSSSSHSISIADENKPFIIDPLYPDENGVLTIKGEEFGGDWFKYNDSTTKAAYAYQQLGLTYDLEKVLKDVTGCESIEFVENWGYIDHDSVGILDDNYEYLKNFIFNKNSWLFGGNDNDDEPLNFKDVPFYNEKGERKEVVYDRKLYINGEFHFNLREDVNEDELIDILTDYLQFKRLTKDGKVCEDYGSNVKFDSINDKNQVLTFKTDLYWHYLGELRNGDLDTYHQIKLARQRADKEFTINPHKYLHEISYEIIKIND